MFQRMLGAYFLGPDGRLNTEKVVRVLVALIAMPFVAEPLAKHGFDIVRLQAALPELIAFFGGLYVLVDQGAGLARRMRTDKTEKKIEAIVANTPGAQETAVAMKVGKAGPIPADARHWKGSADRAEMPPPPVD